MKNNEKLNVLENFQSFFNKKQDRVRISTTVSNRRELLIAYEKSKHTRLTWYFQKNFWIRGIDEFLSNL